GGHHVRRGGQLSQLVVHGLPDPDLARVSRLRARRDGHAVPAPSARGQGSRRVAERRVAARDRERGHRRAVPDARRRSTRHALYPGPCLGCDAGAARATAMMSAAVSRRAQELTAEGTAFVTATVVRAQRPTSAQAGNVALVLGDGTIEGFVGGACAEHSVRAYALRTIETGEAMLLRILPFEGEGPGDAAGTGHEVAKAEGAVTVQNPCLSGGSIEVFLEPVLPAPRVLVVGDTPIAAAVRQLGAQLGLAIV